MARRTDIKIHRNRIKIPLDIYPRGVYNIREKMQIIKTVRKNRGKNMEANPNCREKKERSSEEYKKLANRLSRIEGQIRGVRNMLEESAYCVDILMQVAAAKAALDSFSKELLTEHINTCVADDIRQGGTEKVDELTEVIKRLIK